MQPAPQTLSADEQASLRCVVAHMIPASAEYGVPGADDDAIFSDIVSSLDRDAMAVREALSVLNRLAGGALHLAPVERQQTVLSDFRKHNAGLAAVLVSVAARCYYRDDRVMRSLGMDVRPPYPKGFEVPQGDWSLLEPVRARGKIYRDAG
jgi:hypothetical protein